MKGIKVRCGTDVIDLAVLQGVVLVVVDIGSNMSLSCSYKESDKDEGVMVYRSVLEVGDTIYVEGADVVGSSHTIDNGYMRVTKSDDALRGLDVGKKGMEVAFNGQSYTGFVDSGSLGLIIYKNYDGYSLILNGMELDNTYRKWVDYSQPDMLPRVIVRIIDVP